MKSNILVTGGAGFIGSWLCERLIEDGHQVCAFDNSTTWPNLTPSLIHQDRFNRFHGDVTKPEDLALMAGEYRFDQIIHLAALAGVRASLQQPALYQRVNVEGTANVLEMARLHRIPKIILASSSSVYGSDHRPPFNESLEPRPISPYAASKVAAEALAFAYHRTYQLDVAVLRFFSVYGPRQRPDLAIHKFARLIAADKPIEIYGANTTARDYTHVSNIVEGIVACTTKALGFEVFNLGSGRARTLGEIIGLLEESLCQRARIEVVPYQPGDPYVTCADIERAQVWLNYSAALPTLAAGLQMFVDWFQTQPIQCDPNS